ncbi:MAG: TetR/AcrR family transcriptional regulator C-terminal domain-containing protein [Pseudonocardia sp.]
MTDREPLRRERVLRAAVTLADRVGLPALTMRKLGEALGVEAMSLYRYVSGKDDLLDGMVDAVFTEIDLPAGEDWRAAMRARAESARAVLGRHRWAIGLLESRRAPGPATLRHHDAVLGVLRGAGFGPAGAAHAYALIDSYVFGFALQEASLPLSDGEDAAELAREIVDVTDPDRYPHLAWLTAEHVLQPGYAFGDEFAWGLDLLLDGLDRARLAT